MSKKRILITLASAVLLFAITLGFWLIPKQADSQVQPLEPVSKLRTVLTEKVESVSRGSEVRLSGVTRAANRNRAAFAMSGRLLSRSVELGQQVKKGQVLARLEPDTMRNVVDTAKAALSEIDIRIAQANRDLERSQTLAQVGAVSSITKEHAGSAVTALEAGRRAAKAQLSEAKRQLAQTTLRAPFDGVVNAIFVEPGEVVSAGTPIVALSGNGKVELEIDVPESLVEGLQEGETVRVELPFIGQKNVEGRIITASRVSPGLGRLFPVIVGLPAKKEIQPGLTAEVVLSTAAETGLAVPVSAIGNPSGSRASVFRVIDGRAQRVFVKTGILRDTKVIVQGPLVPGDQVIVSGHTQLLDGEKVEVR